MILYLGDKLLSLEEGITAWPWATGILEITS
jgi:hypothetical protein